MTSWVLNCQTTSCTTCSKMMMPIRSLFWSLLIASRNFSDPSSTSLQRATQVPRSWAGLTKIAADRHKTLSQLSHSSRSSIAWSCLTATLTLSLHSVSNKCMRANWMKHLASARLWYLSKLRSWILSGRRKLVNPITLSCSWTTMTFCLKR